MVRSTRVPSAVAATFMIAATLALAACTSGASPSAADGASGATNGPSASSATTGPTAGDTPEPSPEPTDGATSTPTETTPAGDPRDLPFAWVPCPGTPNPVVLPDVGPGWVIGEYWDTPTACPGATSHFIIASPDGTTYDMGGLAGPVDWFMGWRPERHEIIVASDDAASGTRYIMVVSLVDGSATVLNESGRDYLFIGPLSDGREAWAKLAEGSSAMSGLAIFTPGHADADTYIPRPAVPGNMDWYPSGDDLVTISNDWLQPGTGKHSIWEVELTGTFTEHVLTLPSGVDYCQRHSLYSDNEDLFDCQTFAGGNAGTWRIPSNGTAPTKISAGDVPRVGVWNPPWTTNVPGFSEDDYPAGKPWRWYVYEYPYQPFT